MSGVSLRLFGPPTVEVAGSAVPISRHKALAPLAYLTCGGRPYTREHLVALLWPESDGPRARAGSRQALAELTRCLGHGVLAADLAGAQFMEGFTLPDCPGFDEWQADTRSMLWSQAADLRRRLVGVLHESGEISRATEQARKLAGMDPLDESHRRLLMRLLFEAGDRRGAIREYQDCRERLMVELGVEPEHETVALLRQIQRAPARARPASAMAPADAQSTAAPGWSAYRLARPLRVAMAAAAVLAVSVLALLGPLRGWVSHAGGAARSLAVLPVKPR